MQTYTINRKVYKGRGRPSKTDYLPTFWQKWGFTITAFTIFFTLVITWFGGAVRMHKAYAETQRPFLNPRVEGTNFIFVDEPIHKEKPTIESLFYKYDWNAELMIAICKSENGYHMWDNSWKPEVQYKGNDNGSTDTGLCMINSIHGYGEEWLKVAENNLEAAYKVWSNSGYKAWSDYKNGRYLKFYEGK